jgi:hypothetical protein
MIERSYIMKRILPVHHQNMHQGDEVPCFCMPFAKYPDKLNATSGHLNFSKIAHPNLHLYFKHNGHVDNLTKPVHVDIYARTHNWMAMKNGKAWKVFH